MAEHTFAGLLFAGLGLTLVVLGRRCATGRLRRNALVGIRMSSTMRSPEAWAAGHRAAARVLVASGVVAVAGGGLAAASGGQAVRLGAGVVVFVAATLGGVAVGAIRADRAASAVNRR